MAIAHLKFQKMLYILRLFGTFTNTWPPHPDVGKTELFLRNLYYYVAIFISMAVWIPMIISIYNSRNDDIGILMKNVSHAAAIIEAILNSIFCRIKRRHLQGLLISIEKFTRASNNREKVILEKYVDRYATFILVVATSFIMAGVTVICAPLFMPLEFPTTVWYPFSTKPLLRKFILYIMQIFIITHTVLCFGVDVMIAVFLFYSTARIEMLSFEVEQAANEISIISCVKKHQEIIGE
ncbi:PREDICTED: uncharacterized protein LOC105557944 [Vollenhovia emeryi]|uniref:uncharacterized protein LOC105557944 n=1 Tax=Vollenhovia emeryi TaxID=411798 RepID=UPI0005F4D199|nr:PREDICTED: uncharacterized protein LOC105557944 [Vollenhovia emeryi]